MKEKKDKELLDLIELLKEAINDGDNESAHGFYDDILYLLASRQDAKTIKLINKIRNGMSFWYA